MTEQEKQLEALGIKTFSSLEEMAQQSQEVPEEVQNTVEDENSEELTDEPTEQNVTADSNDGNEQEEQGVQTEEVQEPEAQLEESSEEEEITDEDIVSFITGQFGVEFNSLSEIEERLKSSLNTEPAFASEEIRQINDFIKETGRDINDYYFVKAMNVSEMDDVAVMKMKYQMLYPDLSAADIEVILDDTFKLSEDEYTERELRLGKARMKTEAANARNEIRGMQSEYMKPIEKKQETQNVEERNLYSKELMGAASNLETLEFDNLDWKFTFSDKDKKELSKSIGERGVDSLFDTLKDKNGNFDLPQVAAAKYLLENADTLLKLAIEHGKGLGRKEVVEQTKNPSYESSKKTSAPTMSPRENIAQQIFSQMSQRTLNIKK